MLLGSRATPAGQPAEAEARAPGFQRVDNALGRGEEERPEEGLSSRACPGKPLWSLRTRR